MFLRYIFHTITHTFLIFVLVLGMGGCSHHTSVADARKNKVFTELNPTQTQQVRDIFQKNIDSLGGIQAIQHHTSYTMTGTMEEVGNNKQHPFTIQRKAPNSYYIRVNLVGIGIYERGFDGEKMWERTPSNNRILPNTEYDQYQELFDFYAVLHHEQWYPKILALDQGEFGGERCHAILVETTKNTREQLFFSQQTGLQVGVLKIGKNTDTDSIIRYGQYVPQNDVKVPMYWEEKLGDLHKLWKVDSFVWDQTDADFHPPFVLNQGISE